MFFGHQFVPLAKPKNTVDTTTSLRPRNGNVLVDYHNWLVNDTIHAHEQEWLQVWGWIAGRYKDYHHLIFEGYNEPSRFAKSAVTAGASGLMAIGPTASAPTARSSKPAIFYP